MQTATLQVMAAGSVDFLTIAAALAPLAVALALVMGGRGVPLAAAAGMAVALALVALTDFSIAPAALPGAAATVLILALSVAMVVAPGQYLVAVLRAHGIIDGLAARIDGIAMARERKALITVLGIAPAVESLTGFGVSMFISLPILLHLYGRRRGFYLGLLGMNIMPWGTFALATLVGSAIAGVDLRELGIATSMTSALVFPLLGVAAVAVMGGGRALRAHGWFGLALGVALSALLFVGNRFLVVEAAGVFAGAGVILMGALLGRPAAGAVVAGQKALAALTMPYLLLVGLIVGSRAVPPLWEFLSTALVLQSGELRFAVLTSPGVMLAVTAALVQAFHRARAGLGASLRRSCHPVACIFAFLVLAQTMREAGMVGVFAEAVGRTGAAAVTLLTPLLGALSGAATGSNVSGNVLMMPALAEVGARFGASALFAAAQNSAAGHAVFGSVPIIVLAATIARECGVKAPPVGQSLRFALWMQCAVCAAVMAAFAFFLHT